LYINKLTKTITTIYVYRWQNELNETTILEFMNCLKNDWNKETQFHFEYKLSYNWFHTENQWTQAINIIFHFYDVQALYIKNN